MTQARYSAALRGHFGLAATHYCHFTSPIRRYPDLMVHRILKQTLRVGAVSKDETSGVAPEDVGRAADHSSERERAAMEVERDMVDYHSARWAAKHIGEQFDGVVSGVTPRGLFVELFDPFIEGMVPADHLGDDVEHIEDEMALVDHDSGEEYRIGRELRVVILGVDPVKRKITFGLAKPKS